METLNFNTGLVTFSVNGKCEVSFNPTDTAFVKRLYGVFAELDEKQDAYKAEVEAASGTVEIFNIAERRDVEMRELIDGVLGDGVSAAVFDRMNVYALADGLPVWANFLLTVMEQVDTTFAREQKAVSPLIQKYQAKYKK